jgi:hypothetical protein
MTETIESKSEFRPRHEEAVVVALSFDLGEEEENEAWATSTLSSTVNS